MNLQSVAYGGESSGRSRRRVLLKWTGMLLLLSITWIMLHNLLMVTPDSNGRIPSSPSATAHIVTAIYMAPLPPHAGLFVWKNKPKPSPARAIIPPGRQEIKSGDELQEETIILQDTAPTAKDSKDVGPILPICERTMIFPFGRTTLL